ncbi:unnamed protein product [Blumeria hordei]|uniref:Uncharacterized protein n=1 Tax=Blumeria hordei TaxID=2867405 RepID=A0A383UIS4_BLUHO|nr:unnamed protein product [Blumeria hordei]
MQEDAKATSFHLNPLDTSNVSSSQGRSDFVSARRHNFRIAYIAWIQSSRHAGVFFGTRSDKATSAYSNYPPAGSEVGGRDLKPLHAALPTTCCSARQQGYGIQLSYFRRQLCAKNYWNRGLAFFSLLRSAAAVARVSPDK